MRYRVNILDLLFDEKDCNTAIYDDSAAYQSHIQTPHFKKYKEGTAAMVRSLKLIDVNPLVVPRGLVKP